MLFVSQMLFLMSMFKYVCAVFLRLNDLNDKEFVATQMQNIVNSNYSNYAADVL